MVKGANKIAIVYLIVGVAWILFSDRLFAEAPIVVQSLKGISYVVLTAIILWFFLRRNESKNRAILQDLIQGVEDLELKDYHLQQEKNLLRTVIDNLPDYIFVKNVEGKILIANKALVKLAGETNESEMIGKYAADFFPKPVAAMAAQKEQDLITEKLALSEHEFLYEDASKNLLRIHSTKVPVFGPDENIMGIVGISRDITAVYNKTKTDALVLNIINALSFSTTLETALVSSLHIIGDHFGFKFAEAWLVEPSQREVVIAATWARNPESTFQQGNRKSFAFGEGLPGTTLSTKDIQIWNNIMDHPNFLRKEKAVGENLQTGIGIPMVLQDDVIAVFTFLSDEEFYDFTHVKMVLVQVSAQIVLHLERKKYETEMEESNTRITDILESISDGFFAINEDWTVSYWNREAEKLLRMPSESIVGQKLSTIYPDNAENPSLSYQHYKKVMLEKKASLFEEYYAPLNIWLELSVYPSNNGISVFFRDITENKRLNEELNKRVNELAVSNAELEQFAYIASHDLQEPLRMVTGFLSQLDKKYSDRLDEKARKYIHFAVDGAVRMRKIILDLLDYSKVGKMESQLENIDISELIADILQLNAPLIKEEKVVLTIGKLPIIYGVRTLLQQVFQNLIVNAIRYKQEHHHPVIEISASEEESHWRFAVTDNGIGIKSDFYDKVFVLFQRLHSREQYSGTGIGLAICKKIVESHGGRIWIESTEGLGSTFYFTIKK